MRRIFLLLFFSGTVFALKAQSKLGLKFSPSISSNRVSLVDSLYNAESIGSQFKFSIGLIYDHEITETYFFSTGLIFVPKYVGIEVSDDPNGQFNDKLPDPPRQEYRLNYLQIPATLKLFTNEVQPNTKIFFQVGMAVEIKVFDDPLDESYDLINEFRFIDAPIIFGGGVEYRAGVNTTLFGSITYQRGLINSLRITDFDFQQDEELYIRNTILSLDLGIKF